MKPTTQIVGVIESAEGRVLSRGTRLCNMVISVPGRSDKMMYEVSVFGSLAEDAEGMIGRDVTANCHLDTRPFNDRYYPSIVADEIYGNGSPPGCPAEPLDTLPMLEPMPEFIQPTEQADASGNALDDIQF